MKSNILIIAGETSGDIHASNLLKHLKRLDPGLEFSGIGGSRMRAEGVRILEPMENLSIIGVTEIFFKLGALRRAYSKIMREASARRPKAAILVDYPGFNLRLARKLKAAGIPVIYYITPQIWAWGFSRIKLIKRFVNKALVIFKFEEEIFKKHGIDAEFVGHPLLDGNYAVTARPREGNARTIALLPGSRENAVKNILPLMLGTARCLSGKGDFRFSLLKSSSVKDSTYGRILKERGKGIDLSVYTDDTASCLSASDFVFTSSGTATLECAIMEKPMLITYKTSFLTAVLFRIFAATRRIGLVNIIAGREIAPEVLQYDATPSRICEKIFSIISSGEKMERQAENLRRVRGELGKPGASRRAAEIISGFLR